MFPRLQPRFIITHNSLNLHHFLLKLRLVPLCLIAYLTAIDINRIDGITEETGNLIAVRDAEADEGKDANLGAEQLAGLGIDFLALGQKLVELLDEMRVEVEERLVETSKLL